MSTPPDTELHASPESTMPLFMGEEHVRRMNQLMAADKATRKACAELERPWLLAYELNNAPNGGIEWWLLQFDPQDGCWFELTPPPREPDLVFKGEYAAYIEFIKAAKEGKASVEDEPVERIGDMSMLEAVGPAFAAGRAAAAIPAKFPEI